MVIIIGQIEPKGSLKTTTLFIRRTELVLSSSRGQNKLFNVEACREMMCDIAKGSVNRSSSARCRFHKSGYTACDA